MKVKIEIKNRFTGKVLFEFEKENNTIKQTVIEAVKEGVNLSGVNLSGADLSGVDLSGVNLSGANLRGVNLSGVNLSGADLRYADLRYADLSSADLRYSDLSGANLRGADLRYAHLRYSDLSGANLRGADLSYADLSGADLSGADLSGANLRGADLRYAHLRYSDLSGADLSSADLSSVKNDMFIVLLNAIPEVPNFRKALIEGHIDGSTYSGECSCLCGTLMKSTDRVIANRIDSLKDTGRPIERFFLAINKGDTPETSQFSKLALEWVDEFITLITPKQKP